MTTAPTKVVSVDGMQIATYERGHGPALVMINGLGASVVDWGPLADLRAQRARLIMFDNRGAGRSSQPTRPFTLEQMADDAAAVFDAYGLRSAYLLGHSMGGMIAQLVAARRPELVERLVLIGRHAGSRIAVPSAPEARAAMFSKDKIPRHELVRRQLTAYAAPRFRAQKEAFERMIETRLANLIPVEAWQFQLQAVIDNERLDLVRSIRAPTLILHGREDSLIPFGNGEMLRDLIPGARLVALEECGHMVSWEKPEETAAAVAEFLAL